VTSKLILVPLKTNAGVLNGISLTLPLPTWSSLVNNIDASQRWFPLPEFQNVELPKADSVFEEANSGKMAFIRQGKRSFTGELWASDASATFLGKLASGRCVEMGAYIVDLNGNLIGSKSNGMLYPIPVDNQSWDPKLMFATDSTVQKIMLSFDFNRFFDESTLYMITPTEASQDFNLLTGLIDVNLNVVSQATGVSATVKATFDYGTALNPIAFQGGVLADFQLYNTTTNASVTITGVSESQTIAGQYTILAPFIATNSYRLRVVKVGFLGEKTFTAT
jgi:hypothetical protein